MTTTQQNKDGETTNVWHEGVMTTVPTQRVNPDLPRYRKWSQMSESTRWMVRRDLYRRNV